MKRRKKETNDFLIEEPSTGTECYQLWKERIEAALHWRREVAENGDKLWDKLLETYSGENKLGSYVDGSRWTNKASRNRVLVNKVASDINTLHSLMTQGKRAFVPDPRKAEKTVSAEIQAGVLNYEWEAGDMDVELSRLSDDFLQIGHCIAKVGFDFPLEDVPSDEDVVNINYFDSIRTNHPFMYAVSPYDFIYDYDCFTRNIDSARWVCELHHKAPADVFANSSYDQDVLDAIKNGEEGYIPNTEEYQYNLKKKEDRYNDEREKHCDQFTLYELWDKRFMKYYVFLDGVWEKPLREGPWPYAYLRKFPYVKADCIRLKKHPYGLSLIVWMLDQQEELNRLRTRYFNATRNLLPKILAMIGQIDPAEAEKLSYSDLIEVIWTKNPQALTFLQQANLSADNYNLDAIVKGDMDMITGISALMSGGPLPGRTSASEVSIRTNYGTVKLSGRSSSINKLIKEVGRLMLAHHKKWSSVEELVKLLGPIGEYKEDYSDIDIQEEADLDLEITDAPDISPQAKQAAMSKLFTDIVNTMPVWLQSGQQINMTELLKMYLMSFGIKDIGRIFPAALIVSGPLQQVTQAKAEAETPVDPQASSVFQQGAEAQPESAMMGNFLGGNPTNGNGMGG